MKRAIVVVILALLTGTNVLLAQDQRVFNQFFMNPYIYNPAYAGVEGHTVFYGLYRMQYMGIEGAPSFSHINFHTPLENNMAIGALAYNESEGPLRTSGGKVSLGYILEVDDKHYVRFGMSLGGGYTGYDPEQIDVGLDPTFQNLSSSSFITADFGVSYHFDHFNIGFAMPNLLGREVITDEGFAPLNFNDNMMLKVNYRGHINDNFAIEPHIIYRFSTVNMPQYEVTTLLHIMHIAWAGASYRQDAGFAALVGLKVKDQFGIGFAYEIGNSQLSDVSSGTAEVHIGYHLGKKKKHHKHSHSFIKSHRKTKEQREREEARRQRLAEQRQEQAAKHAEEAKIAREARAAAAATAAAAAAREKEAEEAALAANAGNRVVSEAVDKSAPVQLKKDANGKVLVGTTYVLTKGDDSTEKEVRWGTGAIPKSDKRAIDRSSPVQERTLPNGKTEIGVTYIFSQANGTKTKVVRWQQAKPISTSNQTLDSSAPELERSIQGGGKEIGTTYIITKSDGTKFKVIRWEAAPVTIVSEVADSSSPSQERRDPDGKVEIGTTYVVTNSDGSTSKVVRWEPISEEAVAAGTATVAASGTKAKPDMINHNTAKKGNHFLELPIGHHVVAAQFKDFDEAEDYSDRLFERGFHGTIVGYVSAVGEYFVVVHKGATPTQAAEEQKKWQKLKDLDHVYIFNVVE
ncbi:MAG: PorP/SprF family type IX secretion system membrane protein [Reichenbachiella sp.]